MDLKGILKGGHCGAIGAPENAMPFEDPAAVVDNVTGSKALINHGKEQQ